MSDTERVRSAIAREVPNGRGWNERFISHGTARTIGAWFNDGGDTAIYSFVSTGAIHDGDAKGLHAALLRGVDAHTLRELGNPPMHLERYLHERVRRGETGPVPGWSGMWVEDVT